MGGGEGDGLGWAGDPVIGGERRGHSTWWWHLSLDRNVGPRLRFSPVPSAYKSCPSFRWLPEASPLLGLQCSLSAITLFCGLLYFWANFSLICLALSSPRAHGHYIPGV